MKQYKSHKLRLGHQFCCLIAGLVVFVSCRKEMVPEPSNLDVNYFVVSDNPNDSIDHSIYNFYIHTGIPCFYNDTIFKKELGKEGKKTQRHSYMKLSLEYAPFGNTSVATKPLSARSNIPAFLTLLQEDVIPRLPTNHYIPSILVLDHFANTALALLVNVQISHGWTSLVGFNTVGILAKNVYEMNREEEKMYAASILAGIAAKKITERYGAELQKDFFSVSRDATKSIISFDLYSTGLPYLFAGIPANMVPLPEDIGLLFHTTSTLGVSMPREADDMRAFITAAFYYTSEAFSSLHQNNMLVLKKYKIIRKILEETGFTLPE